MISQVVSWSFKTSSTCSNALPKSRDALLRSDNGNGATDTKGLVVTAAITRHLKSGLHDVDGMTK